MSIKKVFALILSALIILSVFSGCGKSAATDNSTNNTNTTADETKLKGEIEMWSTFTELENKVLTEKVIPAFNQKYPDIKVNVTPMPSGDDYKKKIITAATTGTTPDLARIDITDIAQYANEGFLLAVDDLPGFKELKDATFEGPMDTNFFNGHYYGVPLDTNTKVAIYNKRLLAEAGFTEAPKTMDELEQAALKIKEKKVKGIAIGGANTWSMPPYFLSLGGKFTDENNQKATGYFNSPESVKALEKIVEWKDKGIIGDCLLGGEGTWEGFNNAHYMMLDDGPWWYPANKEQKEVKDNVIFAPIPKGAGGSVSIVGGEDTIIFKDSKNKEQAWAFAKFLASDEAQTIFAQELGMMPVCKATANKDVVTNNPILKVYVEQLSSTWARTPSAKWGEISNVIGEAFEKALRKKATPKDALDAAAAKIDELLSQK
ncbi:carbohydrate ABC transporter substrate-binding protein, CUT1 family [Caloramator quimbayensis]|uniref:Carbohydrate ABC transporter substrate-binding protein, CUT1 family n=1 Tax=Caloramator quimbayensis TaxID=1147123 RepID=A0A1T4XU68_9CLOT|nr:extracellular solute-binding protein [Caloramator quimbayensis]SKA93077.1 carbohydrate ABC transporter substrate-binding protein, CUT1 family [Caloramator quimbayensis]